jgi:hypothetical protein
MPVMDSAPRQALAGLIRTYGPRLIGDPGRCEGLLRDTCAAWPREVFVLVHALRQRVPADLVAAQGRADTGILFPVLVRRLRDQCAFEETAAAWAVESWAVALGLSGAGREPGQEQEPERPAAPVIAAADIAAVEAALADPDVAQKIRVIRSLASPGDRVETAVLIRALGNGSWQVRYAAFEALVARGTLAEDPLILALGEGDGDLIWRAALILGAVKSRAAVPALTRILKNGAGPAVQRAIAWALGEIDDPAAGDALIALLQGPDVLLRDEAKEALEKLAGTSRQP